jgi:hypothetical protein
LDGAVAPVEVELGAGDGHEFKAVDAEALEVGQAVDDALEGVVELVDV